MSHEGKFSDFFFPPLHRLPQPRLRSSCFGEHGGSLNPSYQISTAKNAGGSLSFLFIFFPVWCSSTLHGRRLCSLHLVAQAQSIWKGRAILWLEKLLCFWWWNSLFSIWTFSNSVSFIHKVPFCQEEMDTAAATERERGSEIVEKKEQWRGWDEEEKARGGWT